MLPTPIAPNAGPRQPLQRFLLARSVFLIESSAGPAFIPRRDLQADLNRVGGSRISRHLRQLCEDGWLRVEQKGVGLEAHRYALGPLLTRSKGVRRQWVDLSQQIFGPRGILEGLAGRPCLAYDSLGTNGTLILGVLRRAGLSMSTTDVATLMSFWMTRDTVRNQLRRMAKHGLVTEDSSGWSIAADWEMALDQLEALGPSDRKEAVLKQIAGDRATYRLAYGVSAQREDLKDEFAGWPCVRCSRPSDTIEHFPPITWGGGDSWYLVYPSCRRCNSRLGRFVRHIGPPPVLDVRSTVVMGVDTDAHLARVLDLHRSDFYTAFDNGDIGAAHKAAGRALALMRRHLVPGAPGYEVVDGPLDLSALDGGRATSRLRPVRDPSGISKPARRRGGSGRL